MFVSRVQPHVGQRFLRGRAHHHRTASLVEDHRSVQVTILSYPLWVSGRLTVRPRHAKDFVPPGMCYARRKQWMHL